MIWRIDAGLKENRILMQCLSSMEKLFDGKILILDDSDIIRESQDKKNKNIYDIKGGLEFFRKANYVIYYDKVKEELTVLKERREVKKR